MSDIELYKLKFPIGEFEKPEAITNQHIKEWISSIEALPKEIIDLTNELSEAELGYKYRPNSWTIKQVVHHCADSHINSLLRFKLTLTEETPTIRPYFEDRFAELIDYTDTINTSISILKGVHRKLGILLRNLSDADLKLEFVHPEHGKHFTLEETIGVYAWHSNHHLAHIKQALNFKDKY